jgi:hypothetical protein
VTGIEAEVNYLFHGPLGLQTRDFTWKPEYRQAVKTSIETLRLLKRTDSDIDANSFINDTYIRTAFKQAGLDYDKQLKNYAKLPLKAKDAVTGKPIADFKPPDADLGAGRAAGAPLRQRRAPRSPNCASWSRPARRCAPCTRTTRTAGLKLLAAMPGSSSAQGDQRLPAQGRCRGLGRQEQGQGRRLCDTPEAPADASSVRVHIQEAVHGSDCQALREASSQPIPPPCAS